MIWGEAGIGKTVFCTKFCKDWALVVKENESKGQELTEEQKSELEKLTDEQRRKLNNIGLLLFIVIRDIDKGATPVKDIIMSQFVKEGSIWSEHGLREQLRGIIENSSEHAKLLLLFDGFDEMSNSDENIANIEEVITGRTYQNIQCMITCRPYASHGLVLDVDVEIRLKGFSETQAKDFVKMYARIKYPERDQNLIESFVKETMNQIESSAELLKMSTNPSMLQLLCRLSLENCKIGKDRTSVIKYYTRYLLMQYHIKLGKKKDSYSDYLYHQNLLDAGRVGLMGLKQNHFQLVFSKSEAHRIAGDAIFDIGFLTEVPSTDTESTKIQFVHKMLQEYLAAYYVVDKPDEGLQLLMEFFCTSDVLMGSQMILEFMSNMSMKMGTEIQQKITDYVSTWNSDDKVNHKSRTSFLISMLEGNQTMTFSLPVFVDVDLREYDFLLDRIRKFLSSFFLFPQKTALERFFGMNGHGVRKINLTLGQYNRLNVLQNTTITSLDELMVNGCKTWSKEDSKDLCVVLNQMKPGLLSIENCNWTLMDKADIVVLLQNVHTLILEECGLENEHLLSILTTEHILKALKVNESAVKIDGEVLEAVSKLSSDIKLDISGKEITLIKRSPTMKSLSISNCGIQIDTEIAEAVSRLPDDIQLDLSGNKLTKMDPRLLPRVLLHLSKDEEIDMTRCYIPIDVDIVRALSKLPQLKSLKASYNKLIPKAAGEFSIPQLQQLYLHECGLSDNVCVSLMISLSKHCPLLEVLDLSNSKMTSDKWCRHVQMKKLRVLYLSQSGITDTICVSLVINLSKHCQLLQALYLDVNILTSDEWCPHVQMKQLRELYLSDCGINDTVCVSLTISLSKHCPLLEVLDICNQYARDHFKKHYKKNNLISDEWCPHIQMKELRKLNLSRAGISDTVCESLMISLSKHCPLLEVLNIRYNNLTSEEWCRHVQIEQLDTLNLSFCSMSDIVCESLMVNLSKYCSMLKKLDITYNNLTSSGVWVIVDHIKHMKQLRDLWLYGNPCMQNRGCVEKIREALQKSNPWLNIKTVCT